MAENWEEIMGAALSLPPGMRAMLAEHLLESLDAENQKETDAAWATVAEARISEIDAGKIELVSAESVLQRIKSGR
jgi:putative addiction module component (TIGR02574 family)